MSTLLATLLTLPVLVLAPRAQELANPVPLPGDLAPGPAAGSQLDADIARGGDQYLAVWEDARAMLSGGVSNGGSPAGQFDIYGSRLDAQGNRLDPSPIVITQVAGNQVDPKVAWNGSSWLVVWTASRATQFSTTRGVYGARVSGTGQLLDATPILIDDDDTVDEQLPYVASDGVGWAVLWPDLVAGVDMIAGCTVDPSGFVGPKKVLGTSGASSFYLPTNARLAFCQGRYLMTSEHYTPGGASNQFTDVYGRLFDANLNALGAEFPISTAPGAQAKTWVTANDTEFYVVWKGPDISGTPVTPNGTVLVPGGQLISAQIGFEPQPRAAWDGLGWAVTWETGSVFGAHVSVQGAIDAGPYLVEPPATAGNQLVDSVIAGGAGTPGESIVVWGDPRVEIGDLYTKRIDAHGIGTAASPLVLGPAAQTRPRLAGTRAAGYLVAFLSQTAGETRVVAQRVDAAGAAIDADPIPLYVGGPGVHAPGVAFDGSEWLVVWPVQPSSGLTQARVYGRRVRADGQVLDAAPIDILPGDTADVAALNGTFLVVACHEAVPHFRYIKCRRLDGATGTLLDATEQTVSASYATTFCVVPLGLQWFVTWTRSAAHDSSGSNLRAAFVDSSGIPGAQFDFASSPTGHDSTPQAAVVGNVATVVWTADQDVRSRRMQSDGTALDPSSGLVVSNAANLQFSPAIGSDGATLFAAWNDYRIHPALEPGLGDVFGSRIDANGIALDPAGLAIAGIAARPEGTPAIAGDAGTFLVADVELLPAPHANDRVVVRAAMAASASTLYCSGDGSGTACPCGNASPPGEARGCLNSLGTGARLFSVGVPAIGADSLELDADGLPNSVVLFFQGTTRANGGAGFVFGDGLRCVSGAIIRLGTVQAAGGAAHVPTAGQPRISSTGQITGAGSRTYQAWYRNAAGFCTSATFNSTNGCEVSWVP